jgi:hypothetical protein
LFSSVVEQDGEKPEVLKKQLQDFLPYIRFPCMTTQDIAVKVLSCSRYLSICLSNFLFCLPSPLSVSLLLCLSGFEYGYFG